MWTILCLALVIVLQSTFVSEALSNPGIRIKKGNLVSDSKIIGGDDAEIGEFPWQVSIQLTDDFGNKFPICGGTILSSSQIITAAHCFYSPNGQLPTADLTVVAGAYDIFNLDGTEQIRNVTSAVEHHAFDIHSLSSSLTFTPGKVNSIGIAENGVEPTGSCVATGWGNIRNDGGIQYPDVLQKVSLDLVERDICKDAYEPYNEVTDGMICASADQKGTCLGDSGGPLVCVNGFGQKYLGGIVSWGIEPCASDPELPSVFTNVAHFNSWIGSQLLN